MEHGSVEAAGSTTQVLPLNLRTSATHVFLATCRQWPSPSGDGCVCFFNRQVVNRHYPHMDVAAQPAAPHPEHPAPPQRAPSTSQPRTAQGDQHPSQRAVQGLPVPRRASRGRAGVAAPSPHPHQGAARVPHPLQGGAPGMLCAQCVFAPGNPSTPLSNVDSALTCW